MSDQTLEQQPDEQQPEEEQTPQAAQAVVITLSDGRVGQFVGPVVVSPLEHTTVVVQSIVFSEPFLLPDGAQLVQVETEQS